MELDEEDDEVVGLQYNSSTVENNGVTPPKLVPSTVTEPPFIDAAALLLLNEDEDGDGDHAMMIVGSSTKGTHK